ncbi:MAG: tRNA pseudouridine(55) synthase TruB [Pseudomonadota bacterium]
MARRRHGRPVSGWCIIDKPAGLTSTAVVTRVRRAFGAQKAGHAGTLDPAAKGLLAIALGEATKTVPYVTDDHKGYTFRVRWGEATNTDDADGEVIAKSDSRPDEADIIAVLPKFRGDIQQVPPQFSAVRIDGERAYRRARDGETMEIAPRPLRVDQLDLVSRPDPDTADFHMECGKGGYVRSIARDLGNELGCLGHVEHLRRVWSGPFNLEDSTSLEELEATAPDSRDALLLPIEAALADLPRATCDAAAATRLALGNPAPVTTTTGEYGQTVWVASAGQPIAIGTYRGGMVHPNRVFRL